MYAKACFRGRCLVLSQILNLSQYLSLKSIQVFKWVNRPGWGSNSNPLQLLTGRPCQICHKVGSSLHKYKLKYMIKDIQIQNFYKGTSCLIWQNVGSGFKTNLKLHKLGKPTLQMGIEWCSAVSKGISFKRFAWDEWNYGRESMYMLSVFFLYNNI